MGETAVVVRGGGAGEEGGVAVSAVVVGRGGGAAEGEVEAEAEVVAAGAVEAGIDLPLLAIVLRT